LPLFPRLRLHATLLFALLAPRHLIFTALEGALIDARTDSFAGAEEALSELDRRKIPYILLTSRTRAEIEPLRRKLGHNHPFVTENGGGIFFPDGYFNLRIPGAVRVSRYLSIAQGEPYAEVCEALDDIAEECAVGVAGFHHMSGREIAENSGLRPRDAELARDREFDEPFYFTSADEKAITRFVETARGRGYDARRAETFWHFSSKCDPARAVRTLGGLFRDASHTKLRLIGIGATDADLRWLAAVNQAVLLPPPGQPPDSPGPAAQTEGRTGGAVTVAESGGPSGWNATILNIIGEY
jgi:mannosyl-3-phosphoglycerate phosphatase